MVTGNVTWVETGLAGEAPLPDVAVQLHPDDDVAIAKTALRPGLILRLAADERVRVQGLVPSGHKVALREIAAGEPVRRYGQVIGFASQAIRPGEAVHVHNLGVLDFARDYAFGEGARAVVPAPERERRAFQGYRRGDGRVGTRNYVAVVSTVNCSAHVCREIAHFFTPERLAAYPNVDGVIALTHPSGCALSADGEDYALLQRTLAGMARHPNVAAFLLAGLGCEANAIDDLVRAQGLHAADGPGSPSSWPPVLVLQEQGGTRRTVAAGIERVEGLLPRANACRREAAPASELTLALQCGGSDGWSGVTANPALGLVCDEIVRQGGTVVLSETPEIYGAEHLLTRRAASREVGARLVARIRWWERRAAQLGLEINNNPSPGNKAGGLTTIYEKSLGAVAKAGHTPLQDVVEYAEAITARGFVFMDTPGYDPVSVTGQLAGGCNLVLFTTGRGSCFGFKPAPSLKICSNSATFAAMPDDMDLNAGKVLEGTALEAVAAELLELTLAVASGRPTKSEALGIGEAEFCPWNLGGAL